MVKLNLTVTEIRGRDLEAAEAWLRAAEDIISPIVDTHIDELICRGYTEIKP